MMSNQGFAGKLNLNNMFNLGTYASGLVLILSFVIVPASVDIPLLRIVTFKVLILSLIAREFNILIEVLGNDDLAVFFFYFIRLLYLLLVVIFVRTLA